MNKCEECGKKIPVDETFYWRGNRVASVDVCEPCYDKLDARFNG